MKKLLIIILLAFLVTGGYFYYQQLNIKKINNNQITAMNNIDPKAKALIDQFNELATKLSPGARQNNMIDGDTAIIEQMIAISEQLEQYDTNKINARINSFSYGYDLRIMVNDKDIGITGGGSSDHALFNSDSIMALISTPDVVDHNFVLNSGENRIVIEYKKNRDQDDVLRVKLRAYNDDEVLSVEVKDKTEGKIEKTFMLETEKPADFRTITVSE